MATHDRSIGDVRPQDGAPKGRPERINRRSLFGSFLATGAMLAVPSAALAADPDAELFALQGPLEAAERELDATIDPFTIAEKKELERRPAKPSEPEMEPASVEFMAEIQKRRREINEQTGFEAKWAAYDDALERWELDCARVRAECGLDAVDEAQAAAFAVLTELEARIVKTPAKSIAGLIFKAKYAAKIDYAEDFMTSIVDDLIAMAGKA